jgi:hypothetical protein
LSQLQLRQRYFLYSLQAICESNLGGEVKSLPTDRQPNVQAQLV